jgi:hypothetical protein
MLAGNVIALAALVVCISPAPGRAMMIAPPPVANRVALADCIVVGKVTSLENKNVAARQFPGGNDKVTYRIAVINIKDRLAGAKGLTAVRVGFIPPAPIQGGPNRPIRPILRRGPVVDLKVGQEGCFLLNSHFEEDFYVVSNYYNVMYKNNTFGKDVAQIKHYVKLLEEPKKGLKARDAEDRLAAAGMLITRYRTYQPGMKNPPKTEPIDAQETRLILGVLAEADWTKPRMFGQIQPLQLFFQLGLTPRDGWTPPQMVKDYAREMSEAGKAWIKEHQKGYRIQRLVVEKEKK